MILKEREFIEIIWKEIKKKAAHTIGFLNKNKNKIKSHTNIKQQHKQYNINILVLFYYYYYVEKREQMLVSFQLYFNYKKYFTNKLN